ncbi:MAG: flagellar filament outer layer protein FlaA [Spirochaetota bacterium]|nr:flagellar filament outer layer protein FlaA [Spirochaetota bacterium]
MRNIILFTLIALLIAIPGISQEENAEKGETTTTDKTKITIGDQTYFEITIEDFENTEYNEKNIHYYTKSIEEKAGIAVREDYPAPIKNSKKYLGLKLYGKLGNVLQIRPAKKLLIDKFCRSISIWIFGKNFSGELSILLKDADGNNHRIILGKLNFIGWRKLIFRIPDSIVQQDKYLTREKHIEIMKLIYKPGSRGRDPVWHYFYIDDITAMVREKYTDRQSDDW